MIFSFSTVFARTHLRAAVLAAACAIGGLAQAQSAAPASAPSTAVAAAVPATALASMGRTRAEVVAELLCARDSGELEAQMLRSYGLEPLAPPRFHCASGATTQAEAAAAASAPQAR